VSIKFDGHIPMIEDRLDFLPLRVTHVAPDGRRSFNRQDKRQLIEACLQPGVSVAGMALKANVNANQLRQWIHKYQTARQDTDAQNTVHRTMAAFVPVVEIDGAGMVPKPSTASTNLPVCHDDSGALSSGSSSAPARLRAQLPNGVTLTLECTGQDAPLVSAMIETLGRCDVQARR
jgi:transposase